MAKLRERALLVHLRVQTFTGTRKNDEVTKENCKRYNAEADAGVWLTHFIPKKEKDKLISAAAKLRNSWRKETLPWLDESVRILPAEKFFDYRKIMAEAMAAYEVTTESFIERYPAIIANMPKRLQGLMDKKKMPTVEEIKYRFAVTLNVFPLPDMEDWRLGDSEEEQAQIRQEAESSMREAAKRMMGTVWERMTDLIEKIEERLSDPDKKFHDSLITNLIDFCVDLPKWNLTDDKELEKMRKEAIHKLCILKPDNLRNDKAERKVAAKTAKELAEKMKAYAL